MSAHQALRKATGPAHERVDAVFSALDLADPADYTSFLLRHATAFLPIEEALTTAGASQHIADWDQFRRGPLLSADLAALGLDRPVAVAPPAYPTPAAILGGAYVLEGSRLGGALLRRSVGHDLPRSFLDSVQPQGRWRAFTASLDRLLDEPQALGLATKSALETFALFEAPERNAPSD